MEYEKVLCISGYFIYKDVWEARVGKTLECTSEPGNTNNHQYAMAVEKKRTVIGHLPQKVSHVCTLSLKRDCCICNRDTWSRVTI